MTKTCKITYNDTALNLTFRVPSFQVRKQLREIEKKYSDLLNIIDKKFDITSFDLSDLTKEQLSQLQTTDNYASALEIIALLIPKNPSLIKSITNEDLNIDLREKKDMFYLEVFVLAIDSSKLENEIANNFNDVNIFENEFLTSLDMAEVAYAVQIFRGLAK